MADQHQIELTALPLGTCSVITLPQVYTAQSTQIVVTPAPQPEVSVVTPPESFTLSIMAAFRGQRGPAGTELQRVEFTAPVSGAQNISIPLSIIGTTIILLFVNGLLHAHSVDYSLVNNIATLGDAIGVYAGDSITVIIQ